MVCLAPRAREDSVRPRRSSGAVVRPLNFTVRFRMHQAPAFLLAVLVTLGFNSVPAQTETDVRISADTCRIDSNLSVRRGDVGAKLRELGTPLDAHIHLSVDASAKYEDVSAALLSLRNAGFNHKLGRINYQPQ